MSIQFIHFKPTYMTQNTFLRFLKKCAIVSVSVLLLLEMVIMYQRMEFGLDGQPLISTVPRKRGNIKHLKLNYNEDGLLGDALQRRRKEQYKRTCDIYFAENPKEKIRHDTLHPVQLLSENGIRDGVSIMAQEVQVIQPRTGNFTEKDDILLCIPPKTGTTSWQFVAAAIQNHETLKETRKRLSKEPVERTYDTVKSYQAIIDSADEDERDDVLEDISMELYTDKTKRRTKFIHVRHPFARLYSTWHEKCLKKHQSPYCERASMLESKQSRASLENHIASFYAFVKYLLVRGTADMERHWMPVMDVCQPCFVTYNIISKLETIKFDSEHFLKKVHATYVGGFPGAYLTTKMDYADYIGNLIKLYQEISMEDIERLYEVYRWDFEIFGYDIDPFLK